MSIHETKRQRLQREAVEQYVANDAVADFAEDAAEDMRAADREIASLRAELATARTALTETRAAALEEAAKAAENSATCRVHAHCCERENRAAAAIRALATTPPTSEPAHPRTRRG